MDEGEAEAAANLQPRRAQQAISVHNLVHKILHQAGKARKSFFSTKVAMKFIDFLAKKLDEHPT